MAVICREHKFLFIMVPGTACSVIGKQLRKELDGEWIPARTVYRVDRSIRVPIKHSTVAQILDANLLSEDEINSLTVFATVRNPFDRFVTYYQRLIGEWTDRVLEKAETQLEQTQNEAVNSDNVIEKNLLSRRRRALMRRRRIIRTIGFNVWVSFTAVRWFLSSKINDGRSLDSKEPYVLFPMLLGVDRVIKYENLDSDFSVLLKDHGVTKDIVIPRKNTTPGKRNYQSYYNRISIAIIRLLFRRELDAFDY